MSNVIYVDFRKRLEVVEVRGRSQVYGARSAPWIFRAVSLVVIFGLSFLVL